MTEKFVVVETRVLGARIEGTDGWYVEETIRTPDEFQAALATAGFRPLEIRVIRERSVVSVKPGETFVRAAPQRYEMYWGGWAWDDVSRSWRAPGEPLLPFPGNPVVAECITARFGHPDAGWLPVEIEAGGFHVAFRASNTFDPFPRLVDWLEEVARGGSPRLAVDLEGYHDEFLCFPAGERRRVRFIVTETGFVEGEWRRVGLDVLVERRVLVQSIYNPLACFWYEAEGLRAALDQWYSPGTQEEMEFQGIPCPFPIRSAEVESYLGGLLALPPHLRPLPLSP